MNRRDRFGQRAAVTFQPRGSSYDLSKGNPLMKLRYVLLGAATILGAAHLLKKTRRHPRKPLLYVNSESDVTSSKVFGTNEGRVDKMPKLEYFIEHELFYTCQLLPTDFFIKYCNNAVLRFRKNN